MRNLEQKDVILMYSLSYYQNIEELGEAMRFDLHEEITKLLNYFNQGI